ncbi:IclR family transcriptional regulator [Bradyrhizobium liaoningense]|uniref:IclR family transcriptional regulator n=1 Tax=Bradyrhizobium liaoningense TaxID=43992 RepID=UPI001BAAC001|nr:IclR family transcriptional regulator [Bradyrhizobium liaoningense]MBR0842162.1 IclR family transcriptional regulator [Bradyrhizobium liaoningense]MBR0858084.1 IclR family transcriptional regulator [Bradyrhizobium liaoningense]
MKRPRRPRPPDSASASARGSKPVKITKAERSGRRGIQSIEIGFKILDYLRTELRPVPLKMIAANTGMSAANVHYYLVSFQAVGIVRQETDTGCYALGPYALKLGMAAIEQFDVFAVARPAMTELATTIGHTVFLGVWGNRGPTIIYRVEGGASRPIIELRVGSVLSLLRSALGRNFLAHLPRSLTGGMLDQELKEELARETRVDDAPTTKAEVEEMMDTIRRDGISRCRDALLPNFTSLSAPIFDQAGFMIAAITMMGPIGILDDDLKGPTATALIAHARALSATAGWQPEG